MDFLDLVKPYLEIGVLGLASIFLVAFAWLTFKRYLQREKELIATNKKSTDVSIDKYNILFNTMIEQNQKNYETLVDIIKNKLDDVSNNVINGVTTHRISATENTLLSEKESQINNCLKKVQQKTNAARVGLVRFHNGGRDMNGLSFLKMSMTNECPGTGFASIMPDFQNLFRSFFSYLCESLIKDGKCYINNIEILKTIDTTMYEYFLSRNIKAAYSIAIENNEGSIIGFIIVEFTDKDSIDFNQVDSCLHDKKIKIETILNLL